MSYRRAILFRWSRRDVLAVVALAVVVAFLTGSALFYTSAREKPTDLAASYQPVGHLAEYDSVDRARRVAGPESAVLRFADLEGGSTLVESSPSQRRAARELGLELPAPPPDGVGQVGIRANRTTTVRAHGRDVTLAVAPIQTAGSIPDRWLVANTTVVSSVGPTGALVVSPPADGADAASDPAVSSTSVVRSTLLFFQLGTNQVLRGYVLVVVAAGILGGVTVASVVRMTVSDRIRTVQVIRATGGSPVTVGWLFALRGALLTAAAVALGYASGVIASSLVTSVAVFGGLPTTLSARVTGDAVVLLAGVYLALLVVGFVAGGLAALPAARRPPAKLAALDERPGRLRHLGGQVRTRVPGVASLETELLDWRAVIPTVATVAVFATIVLLVLAGSVVAAPLAGGDAATVLEPGAKHPVASSVPESYGAAFAGANVSASPEILLFGVVNDRPTLVRGANYSSFASVTDARLASGRRPVNASEAVVGVDIARSHDIAVGDHLVVGSGIRRTVDRVAVVGTYRAPGAYDDQVLVSLPSARQLTTNTAETVDFVRLSRRVDHRPSDRSANAIHLVSLSVARPATSESVTVRVQAVNVGDATATRNVTLRLGETRIDRRVRLGGGEQTTLSVTFSPTATGPTQLEAGSMTRTVTVRDPAAISIRGLPTVVPPDSAPRVSVARIDGTPARNATITVSNRTYETDSNGSVRVRFREPGSAVVRAVSGNRTATRAIRVASDARRDPRVSLRVTPGKVDSLSQPTARISAANPWDRRITGSIGLDAPDGETRLQYDLRPGERLTEEHTLARQSTGTYEVVATVDGTAVANATYDVTGDDRLATVVARNTELAPGGGLANAVSVVFGNLTVIVGALVALASAMVSGALVASFARAIHARRRTIGIYRSTGASPGAVLGMVARDAARIGVPSVVLGVSLAVALLTGLAAVDALVFYGIRVRPAYEPATLLLVAAGSLALVFVGALVPTLAAVRTPPAESFENDATPGRRDARE